MTTERLKQLGERWKKKWLKILPKSCKTKCSAYSVLFLLPLNQQLGLESFVFFIFVNVCSTYSIENTLPFNWLCCCTKSNQEAFLYMKYLVWGYKSQNSQKGHPTYSCNRKICSTHTILLNFLFRIPILCISQPGLYKEYKKVTSLMLPHLGKIENNQGTVDNLPNWLWI